MATSYTKKPLLDNKVSSSVDSFPPHRIGSDNYGEQHENSCWVLNYFSPMYRKLTCLVKTLMFPTNYQCLHIPSLPSGPLCLKSLR